MVEPTDKLLVRGRQIREDDEGFVCVDDIHKAAGFSKSKKPNDFVRLASVQKLWHELHKRLTGKSDDFKMSRIWRNVPSKSGTFAHPIAALAYAEFLSPKLAIEVREVFLRFKAGDANLADEVLQKASPEANEWAAKRAIGRAVRNEYTTQLEHRGLNKPYQYGNCTNETYKGLFDGTAKQLKDQRGLKPSANLRDKMSIKEIAFVAASEALSIERMEEEEASGYSECRDATKKAATAMRSAIEYDRKNRQSKLA